jgi:hypothetical protein
VNVALSILRIAAAKHALDVLESQEIPQLADDALNAGLYSDSLAKLYDVRDPVMADVGPLFESALKELGVGIPTQEDAIFVLLRHYARCILEGVLRPREGLGRIREDVYDPADLHARSKEYTGDSHGIQKLMACYWGYEDLEERPDEVSFAGKFGQEAVAALDEEVVNLATAWHRQHSGIVIDPAWLAWNDATVRRIAEGILADKAFGRLPVLADALIEAGCDNEELLEHCRSGNPHSGSACWAVDLLLGMACSRAARREQADG